MAKVFNARSRGKSVIQMRVANAALMRKFVVVPAFQRERVNVGKMMIVTTAICATGRKVAGEEVVSLGRH